MAKQETMIHDSGRLPLVVCVPCVALGLLCLLLAVEILTDRLFGVRLLFEAPAEPLSAGATLGVASFLLLLAFALTNAWSLRRRWTVVADDCLLHKLDWLGGTVRRTTPLGDIAAIEVKPLPGRRVGNSNWRVQVRLADGGVIFVHETSEDEADAVALRLSWAVGASLEHV